MRAAGGFRRLLIVIVASVLATLALSAFANTAAIPVSRDFAGVDELQLNGGTLTLKSGPANRLTADVPLTRWPLMMIRVTDGHFAELGGFDDADPRVLLAGLLPSDALPAAMSGVTWTLESDTLESVTVAGGTLVTDGYEAERLVIYGIAGDARLEGLDLKLLAGNFQAGSTLTASGRVDVYSALETAGGVIDTSRLKIGNRDPGPITDILEAQ
ncbi:MAG: hypothetical protein U1E26_03010 [Coriobacteriia bacterium]|nr:hypothetical protein [Coriobacteriia bacterium]